MINITISDEPKQSVVVPAQGQTRVVKTVKKPAKSVKASGTSTPKAVSVNTSPALASKKRGGRRMVSLFKATGRFANKYAPVAKQAFVPGGIFLRG